MINIITGRPGSGKTYILVQKAIEFLKQGVPVYSNVLIKTETLGPVARSLFHYFQDFDELIKVRDGVIILDEAQVYLNSRKWDVLPAVVQYKLQQHRKHGLHIWGSVQHIARLDVIFRELVGRYFEVRKIGTGEGKDGKLPKTVFGVFWVVEYLPEEAKIKKRNWVGIRFVWMRREICEFYDTLKDVGFEEAKDNIVEVKMFVCPKCGARKILKS